LLSITNKSCQEELIVDNPIIQAEFKDGVSNLYKFLSDVAATSEKCKGIDSKGRLTAKLVIKKDGSIGEVNFIKAPNECYKQEFLKGFKAMPKWKPAFHKGSNVASYVIVSINCLPE
jgi:hypothetical protein